VLENLKQNAINKAAKFDAIAQAKKMVAVYEQAIEDKKAGRQIRVNHWLLKKRLNGH